MPHRNQKIFDEGWQAWTDGALFGENPYLLPFGFWAATMPEFPAGAWSDGWRAAQEDHEEQERERDDYGDRVDFEYDKWRDQ
jgi:hypothetical protein